MSRQRVGAHVSIADGFPAAVSQIQEYGGNCGQVFVGSPRTWSVSGVDSSDATAFAELQATEDVRPWIVHGTYLINFATPKDDLAEKSVATVQEELNKASKLGIDYYTFHPGAHTGAGVEKGIRNIGSRLSELDIPDGMTVLLENTAGGGTSLGSTFQQLQEMRTQSEIDNDQLGVCIDSCHLYAAGYDFTTTTGLTEMVGEIEQTVGLDAIQYLHLNDSKHPCGSNKDEHQHIGKGQIGTTGFSKLINHDAFTDLPMVLETPVDEKGYAWNISQIQSLYDT